MESQTTYDRILSELRSAIVDGRHAPGARLTEVELARHYGASRIPLREAMRRLEAEGLVATIPNRGATVRGLDRRDMDELFAVRLVLERLAVRAAAAVRADLRDVSDGLAARAEQAARKRDLDGLIQADRDFHTALAASSGNRHVVETLATRWPLAARAMRMHLSLDGYPATVWSEHRRIVDAVRNGDVDEADHLLSAHVDDSRAIVLDRIDAAALARV